MGSETLIETAARIVLLPSLVFGVALLVKGGSAVGDGFSGGVVASLGIVVQVVVFGYGRVEERLALALLRRAAAAGLAVVLAVGFAVPAALGDPLLTMYPRHGDDVRHVGTLELTTTVAFDAGVFLIVVGAIVGIVGRLAQVEGRP